MIASAHSICDTYLKPFERYSVVSFTVLNFASQSFNMSFVKILIYGTVFYIIFQSGLNCESFAIKSTIKNKTTKTLT